VEYVTPAEFDRYQRFGEDAGFRYVASGPLVRSSYRAGEFFIRSVLEKESNNQRN
jgi:lipoic acid synthetase